MFLGLGPTQTAIVFYVPNIFLGGTLPIGLTCIERAGMRLDDTDIINFRRASDPFAKFGLEELLQVHLLEGF